MTDASHNSFPFISTRTHQPGDLVTVCVIFLFIFFTQQTLQVRQIASIKQSEHFRPIYKNAIYTKPPPHKGIIYSNSHFVLNAVRYMCKKGMLTEGRRDSSGVGPRKRTECWDC